MSKLRSNFKYPSKGYSKQMKDIDDMSASEVQTDMVRRRIDQLLIDLRNSEFEESRIYQILLEELWLSSVGLPSDKKKDALEQATISAGLEVKTLLKDFDLQL
jgi:hypothetical protein